MAVKTVVTQRPEAPAVPSQDSLLAETELPDGRALRLVDAASVDPGVLVAVIRDAFVHRPPVDPPPPALAETPASVNAALASGFGVLSLVGDEPAGTVIVTEDPAGSTITRVSVRPQFQRLGIASAMVAVTLDLLAGRGTRSVELTARAEFPAVVSWWRRHGFVEVGRHGTALRLRRQVPVSVEVPTADAMRELGRRLAGIVRAGDLLIASGDLGAGKTTLAQGLGEGLHVVGSIISPTFVLSRVHRPRAGGPALVHVDAYRLGSFAELEDLDLEVSLDASVTLVEWGAGIAEGLAAEHLDVDIRRSLDPADETRLVFLTPIGPRWEGVRDQLEALR